MSHIKYEDVASDLIYGEWGMDSLSTKNFIKTHGHDVLQTCLLIDIARSLRILRCDNFKRIPEYLREIRRNTKKKTRKAAK